MKHSALARLAAIVVVSAAIVTACGDDDSAGRTADTPAAGSRAPSGPAPTTSATAATGTVGAVGTTRIVETSRGPVEVPERAAAVVAGDYYGQYSLVDLGVTPVGITGGAPSGEPYASALADVPIVGDWAAADPEQVAAVTPDLVLLTVDTDDRLYDLLSEVAPTVEISFQQLSLEDVMTRVGQAVGREAEAARLISDYEARAAAIADEFADTLAATTWATFSPAEPGSWFLLSPEWPDNAVISRAGVQFSDAVVELGDSSDDYAAERSLEELTLLGDADVILVPADPDGNIDATMQPYLESPIWQALPAVQAGNVFPAPWGTSSIGMADDLLTALETILPEVTSPAT
jgi:iron complex transport system substrate-binding protein